MSRIRGCAAGHISFTDYAMHTLMNAAPAGVLFVCLTASLAACAEPPRPVIGVTSSTTYMDAAGIALEDAAAGGELPVDTMLRPEASNRAQPALLRAEAFVAEPRMAAVVGHSNSAASLAASQLYNERSIVQIAPTASAVLYSEAGPFSFRLVPPDDRQGRFLAHILRDSLPPETALALLYVNDDYGRGLRASVLEAASELMDTLPIVLDLPHTNSFGIDRDVQAHLVEALAASGANAILWLGRGSSLHEVLPAIRDRFGDITIYGGDAVGPGRQLREGDGRWDGVRHIAFVDLEATAAGRAFAARYRERFGVPAGGPEALTYDAMALLLTAVRAGARTGAEIREYLLSLGRQRPPYAGITGPVQFDERGDVERAYHLVTIRDGPVP